MGKPKGFKEKEKKRWMSKDGISSMVWESQIEQKLSGGWHFGHDTDSQKSKNKKWYNNGKENIVIKDGDKIPDGFRPGMWQKRPGGYSKFKYVWYTNGIDQKRLSIEKGDIVPTGWWAGYSIKYKENMRKVMNDKGNYHLLNKGYTDEYLELYHNDDKLNEFINNNKSLTLEEMSKRFNCPIGSVYSLLNSRGKLQEKFDWYDKIDPTTSLEKIVIDYLLSFLDESEIEQHNRSVLDGKELDIYLPKYHLGIECNGTYWHSSSDKGVDKHYHENKSKLAYEKGIRLIHLYEWDILTDKIKSLLKISLGASDKIYARNCTIKEISNREAREFNMLNHLQGHRNAQVTYGLFYKDSLVQLMSFSKTKYNKNLTGDNDWEIIRGCPGSNNIVIGGVSKLFKHFIREYNPDNVFSYCDFNKFDGKSYELLGMKFIGYTGPDKTWIVDGQPIKRNPKKYKELKESADYIVWGAGSKKYMWSKDFTMM